ncbi:Transposase [Chondrus crispus]|uniref:Transposase n=1 Tax=Chondrus crispus TaxID=2769 RepID=R7QK56_CHOCR|nr:Transposase [Chondrus crispus]CDF38907.1 Transposase [Chondrus crispus]|eukprot:XP_005718812.1 Transposase [Chondrus crispus]
MPRGTHLSQHEQGQIQALRLNNWTIRRIAGHLSHSHNVVATFLRNPGLYGKKKRPGRPSKLTSTARRALLREAHKGHLCSSELVKTLSLPVTPSTVRGILRATPTIQYSKIVPAPMMLPRHKIAREQWCSEKVTWTVSDWMNVVWSDEKKFNLDGPDGFGYYWHDLRTDNWMFSKRQQGGDSVMVWGAFSGTKKCELSVLNGKQDAIKYIDTLESYLLPFVDQEMGPSWVFMQDGASIHRARRTFQWFDEEEIPLLEWPAKSPDLNPIENLWGILARTVYAHQRQFKDVDELLEVIMEAWDEVSEECLEKLVRSMQKRCFECVMAKGGPTKY